MEAQALKMPHLPIVIIPHPLGGLKPEEVAERAKVAFQEIAKISTIRPPGKECG
jgi:hypothetical protein